MRAKKSLGQNFLSNSKILQRIVETAKISPFDTVLEIGPGKGSLTTLLAEKAKKVVAVEKDRELAEFLRAQFKNRTNAEIIQGDILKIPTPYPLHATPYKIVANIPYYITSHFLKIFLSAGEKPQLMVLMVQYEVAKRIVAKPGDMNLLALSVQAYGTPKFIMKVSKNYFHPRPKVDSAIISISDISDKWFKKQGISEEKFFLTARRAFGQKRKMLSNSLGENVVPEKYKNRRPQDLSLEDWADILEHFS